MTNIIRPTKSGASNFIKKTITAIIITRTIIPTIIVPIDDIAPIINYLLMLLIHYSIKPF